jgi:hypothetical protein
MYAVRIVKSVEYFDTIVKRLRTTYSEYSGHRMPDQVIVELWKHNGNDERYVLTIYSQDERLPQLAASVMGTHGLKIVKDIDQHVKKERGPIRREIVRQKTLRA